MENHLNLPQKFIFLNGKAVAPIHRAAAFSIRQKANSFAFRYPSKVFLRNFRSLWQNGLLHSLG